MHFAGSSYIYKIHVHRDPVLLIQARCHCILMHATKLSVFAIVSESLPAASSFLPLHFILGDIDVSSAAPQDS